MVEQVKGSVAIADGFRAVSDYNVANFLGVNYPMISTDTHFAVISKLTSGDYVLQSTTLTRPTDFMGKPVGWDYCILATPTWEAYGDTACSGFSTSRKWSPKPQTFLKPEKVYKYSKGSFKQELIYNGKSKDMLKLQYREYKDDFARAAFFQDLIYDLTESKTVGFKGMTIDILEATNSYIKFIVKSKMN